MSQQLINLSPDLKRLRDEGYEIQASGGYLYIHQIPYLNSKKELKYGTLISELTLAHEHLTAKPSTHTIYFKGEAPCTKEGQVISAIYHSSQNQKFTEEITGNHMFSNKPSGGYPDYYQKVTRYIEIVTAPAKSLYPTVTEKTFKVIEEIETESVFHYCDTNSSRANISLINAKLEGQRIGIIGLGGTGSYLLDFISKTPVQEIHLFDGDAFLQHNAFRSPGAASIEQLKQKLKKGKYLHQVYSNIHRGIFAHGYVLESNLSELDNLTFVFIAIDKSDARKCIVQHLLKKKIPFIDVGLGVSIAENNLVGAVRVTTATEEKTDHLEKRLPLEEIADNDYNTNIQIADLNALNAVLAVIKWKKMYGFYQDLENEHHNIYSVNVSQLLNADYTA